MSNHEQTKRPLLTQSDEVIINRIQATAKLTSTPPTPEGEALSEIVAFAAMREIHKRGPSLVVDEPTVRGHFIERTPEQQAEHERTIRREGKLFSLAAGGLKFTLGRKTDTVSLIRKAIARELKRHHDMKNRELWNVIATKPPKGWEFCDNRLGRYAEASGGRNMSYRRFCNVCAEERRKLKN